MVTVLLGNSAYSMTRAQADALVGVAAGCVAHGVYAVERAGVVEMRNDAMDPADVGAAVAEWASHGWQAHANR